MTRPFATALAFVVAGASGLVTACYPVDDACMATSSCQGDASEAGSAIDAAPGFHFDAGAAYQPNHDAGATVDAPSADNASKENSSTVDAPTDVASELGPAAAAADADGAGFLTTIADATVADAGAEADAGPDVVSVDAADTGSLAVDSSVPCTDACSNGATQCGGGGLEVCDLKSSGCLGWTAEPCPVGSPVCMAGGCVSCTPNVTPTQCAGSTPQFCASTGQWQNVPTGACTEACSSGTCIPFPSCAVSALGTTNCGPNSESCCATEAVTGGTFDLTYTSDALGNPTGMSGPATVSSFRLDKYEITVGRFRQYVNYLVSGGSPPANGSGKHAHLNAGQGLTDIGNPGSFEAGWDALDWNAFIPTGAGALAAWTSHLTEAGAFATWTATPAGTENLPINSIDWYEAYAFCIWDGGFLPSRGEWEYAAAGGSQQRAYPWGATAPGTSSLYAIYGCNYPTGLGTCAAGGPVNVANVGTATLGAGLWGQLDLGGSVNEWNLDWTALLPACVDCADIFLANADALNNKILPGSAFNLDQSELAPADPNAIPASLHASFSGARCARSP